MDLARIGFIGCGRFATTAIYPSLHYAPIDLVAVCSLDEAQAQTVGRWFGAKRTYTDYREMLAREELDGVFCITGGTHHRIAMDVLEKGLPVYVEKPPAPDLEGARALLETSRRTGRWVQVGFMKRFAPAYRRAREIVHTEEFGRPTHVYGKFSGDSWTDDPWNFVTGMTIHYADLLRFFLGEVEEVTAYTNTEGASLTIDAALRFACGTVGIFSSGEHLNWYGHDERLEVAGQGAQVIVDNHLTVEYYPPMKLDSLQTLDHPIQVWTPSFTAIGEHCESLLLTGYIPEVRHFAECILAGKTPEVTIADGYEAMRICRALVESNGRPKKVADI